jgi:hypothetical protein
MAAKYEEAKLKALRLTNDITVQPRFLAIRFYVKEGELIE